MHWKQLIEEKIIRPKKNLTFIYNKPHKAWTIRDFYELEREREVQRITTDNKILICGYETNFRVYDCG